MANGKCTAPGCDRVEQLRRGLCNMHRQRLAKTGTLDDPPPVTVCAQGHDYTPENTYTDPAGKRHCKICIKVNKKASYKRKEWPPCSLAESAGCPRNTRGGAMGWCASHYNRYKDHGDPLGGPPVREWRVPADEQQRRRSEYNREYHETHREELNAGRRERYRADPEQAKAAQYSWRERNPDRYLAHVIAARDRRRAVIDAAVELVERAEVIARHGMVCHLCAEPITHLGEFELDHVIPLARGGSHTYDNVKPAHRRCNRRKGARLPS